MPGTITRSPRTRVTSRTNYYPNPVNQGAVSGLHAGATAYNTGGAAGTYAIATGAFQQINANPLPAGSRFGFYYDVTVSAAAGVPVAFAAFLQALTGPGTARVWIDAYTSGGAQVGHADTTTAGGTVNLSVTPTQAINRLRVYVWIENGSGAAQTVASSLQIARYVVEVGVAVAGAFFYGGQGASGTTTYAWSGTVNNSPSLQIDDNPADVLAYVQMDGFKMTRPNANTVIPIPGRDADAVVLHKTRKRRGTISLVLGVSDAVMTAAEALLTQQAQFILADTDRPLVNMTFAVDEAGIDLELDDETRSVWVVTIPAVQQ